MGKSTSLFWKDAMIKNEIEGFIYLFNKHKFNLFEEAWVGKGTSPFWKDAMIKNEIDNI